MFLEKKINKRFILFSDLFFLLFDCFFFWSFFLKKLSKIFFLFFQSHSQLLSQQLVLCQVIIGLSCLRQGGNFLSKLFNTFLPATIHSLYFLYLHFEEFAIIKPNQSRPANSERYVVCRGFKGIREDVLDYLYRANDAFNSARGKNQVLFLRFDFFFYYYYYIILYYIILQ